MNFLEKLESPIGSIIIEANDKGITKIEFGELEGALNPNNLTKKCKEELELYFQGKLISFDIPLDFVGTSFQKSVWKSLLDLKYGQISSYKEIAKNIDNAGAMRAVGAASNKNPIAIIVPCHRIIATDGKLTGYNAGLERKRWLLEHENKFKKC